MHSFAGKTKSIKSKDKKSRKRLCMASYCYSITMDRYWWFWQNGSFSSVFSLFHIITALPLLEARAHREREESIYSI